MIRLTLQNGVPFITPRITSYRRHIEDGSVVQVGLEQYHVKESIYVIASRLKGGNA